MNLLAELPNITISWVDLLVVILLIAGVFHGRKRGMSEELLDIIKWTLIVGLAGLLYEPGGRWLARMSVFSLLFSYICAYVLVAILIFTLFVFIKRKVGEKLVGSDVFGRAEYYLGMVAGAYRYLCIVLVAMAFLNARHYDASEIAEKDKFQDHNFGTKLIPTVPDLQKEVFDRSFAGRNVQDYLNVVLIRPTAVSEKNVGGENSLSRQRERTFDQILDKK